MASLLNALAKTKEAVKKSRLSFFGRVRQLVEGPRVGPEVWEELEEVLVLADVGVGVARELIGAVRQRVEREGLSGEGVLGALKEEMVRILGVAGAGAAAPPPATPRVILVIGVNGSGKTTSIAKLAYHYKQQGQEVILAAADTFRAAAIDQLRLWATGAGAQVVAHQPGADPAAVVYDAIQAARARGVGVVIADTAGRLHTKYNLMEELKKIKRAASRLDASAPQQVLLVLDATTGQNGLAQAKHFTQAVGVDGIFLAKLDGTAKGGIVLAIARELNIPILYIGTGEGLEDMAPFDPRAFVEALCSP